MLMQIKVFVSFAIRSRFVTKFFLFHFRFMKMDDCALFWMRAMKMDQVGCDLFNVPGTKENRIFTFFSIIAVSTTVLLKIFQSDLN